MHLEREVLLQLFSKTKRSHVRACQSVASWATYVLDDHDQEGKLDRQGLLRVDGAGDVVGGNVGAHDLEHRRLNVRIGQPLDVTVAHLLLPDLERLGAKVRKTVIRSLQTRAKPPHA